MSDSLRPHELQPTRLLRPWDFPGKSTGVGCQCLGHVKEKELAPSCLIMVMLIKIVMTVQSGSQVVEGVSSGVKEPRFES